MALGSASMLVSFEHLSYIAIFFLSFFEGTTVNFISSFAASLGYYKLYMILAISTAGNIIGDVVYYSIGRRWKNAIHNKYLRRNFHAMKIKRLRVYLKNNPGKAMMIIKLTPIIPIPGLILAGTMEVPWKKFLLYSSVLSAGYCTLIALLGYYSGAAFGLILDYFKFGMYVASAFVLAVLVVLWFGSRKLTKQMMKS